MGLTSIPCLPHGDKLVQSICFLTVVYSFTHVRSSIQDKEYRCLILESTQRLELASKLMEDVWLDSNFQKDGQSECFSMRAKFKNPSSLLVVSLSRGIGMNFAQTLTQYSQTQLHMEERVLHRDANGALDVAQELQMPIGPQALDDEEEPMPSPPAKLKDPIELDQHSLTHFPSQPWCTVCVESRGRDSPQREQSKIDAVVQ